MVAVDWDGDGDLDLVELGRYSDTNRIDLFLNNGAGGFTATNIGNTAGFDSQAGLTVIDYNWDGVRDVLVSQYSVGNNAIYIQNTNKPVDGSVMHLRITDYGAINSYMANTVQLFDEAGIGGNPHF